MLQQLRTALYLLAAGIVWFAEDFVFSRGLRFNAAQTAVVTLYFLALFGSAVWLVLRTHRRLAGAVTLPGPEDFTVARLVSLAPVLTLVVGSFAALPVIILVLLAGSIL